MQPYKNNSIAIQRLTALWALCESGLGGWMHALKIPLTGFFVGGFAVVIISLLAFYTRNNFRQIIQATIIVLLVKAAVSPQSPLPAYVAVSFQGVIGALLFRILPDFKIASVLFAVIAMLESGLQKLLMMTIVFGTSIWEALNKLFEGILKDFRLPADTSFSFWVIIIYSSVYALWGLIIGLWIARLPERISAVDAIPMRADYLQSPGTGIQNQHVKKNKTTKILLLLSTLLFVAGVFVFSGSMSKALYVILRTLAVLLLIYLIINPIVKWLLQRWLKKSRHSGKLQPILDMLPELRSYIRPAYQMAAKQNRGLRRYTRFLFLLLIFTLKPASDEP